MNDWLNVPRFSSPARCAETDPEAFFPDQGVRIRKIREICNRCEALDECLTYALDHELDDDSDGVWGGTSPEQRRRMRPRVRAKVEQPDDPRITHGKESGERAHRRYGQKPCDECQRAKNEANARRRREKQAQSKEVA